MRSILCNHALLCPDSKQTEWVAAVYCVFGAYIPDVYVVLLRRLDAHWLHLLNVGRAFASNFEALQLGP